MSSNIPGTKKGIPAPSRIRPPGSSSNPPAAVVRSVSSASIGQEATSLSNASSASNLASETEAGRAAAPQTVSEYARE